MGQMSKGKLSKKSLVHEDFGPRKPLGAVHKLRHPIRGYGGVSQKMTQDDRRVGGGLAKNDR